jgi:hypothetical protein
MFPLPYSFADGTRSEPVATSQAPREYPFRHLGDTQTCLYSRAYEQWIDAFTPTASGSEDPLCPGFYLLDESRPEIIRGRVAEFIRVYGNIPQAHIRGNSTIYSRPAVPGSGVLTASTTWDPPAVSPGSPTTLVLQIQGAQLGDVCSARFSALVSQASVTAAVTSTDTVTVTLTSASGTLDMASGSLVVNVYRQYRNYGLPALGNAGLFHQPDSDQEQYDAYSRLSVVLDQGVANLPSGGTGALSFRSVSSASVAYNVSASSLKTALDAMSTVSDFGGVASVTGAWDAADGFLVTLNDLSQASVSAAGITVSTGTATASVVPSFNGYVQQLSIYAAGSYPIQSLSLLTGGTNYSSDPTVTISGGGGSGATATATVSGPVTGASVSTQGSAYTTMPTASISGGGGSGASIELLMTWNLSWSGTTFTTTNGGSGYTSAPTVLIDGVAGKANAMVSGGVVTQVYIPSATYPNVVLANHAPVVSFTGGGGSGAAATVSPAGGYLAGVNLLSGGAGYTSAPTVTVSGGGGSGAAVALSVTKSVTGINLVSAGTGYTSTPAVTISGGGGYGATASATLAPSPALTGGTYPITIFGQTASGIPSTADASAIATALNALSGVQARGGVSVSGGWDGTSIAATLTFSAEAMVGSSSLTPTPSAVTVSTVGGTYGRQQRVKFTGSQSTRLITFGSAHSLSPGDKLYLAHGTAYQTARLDYSIVSDTQISVNPSLSPWSSTTLCTEGGKYRGRYSPGPTSHRTRQSDAYYLPGVTPGVASVDDIPVTAPPISDSRYLDALFAGEDYVVAEDSSIEFWKGPILVKTKTELRIPRA